MKYLEYKGMHPYIFTDKFKHFMYAARFFVERRTRLATIAAFERMYDGSEPEKWAYVRYDTSYPGQDELIVYTHDVGWQALNRLHGDIIPKNTCTIYTNYILQADNGAH